MSPTVDDPNDTALSSQASFNTIYLFGVLTAISLILVWANNEFVMTKEVLAALAGTPGDTLNVDIQYEAVRRMATWGYVLAPVQTAFRIGFVALVVQMSCLLGGMEIPYGRIFRISAIAFGATIFGQFLQIIWIVQQPVAAITQSTLGIVPDSLAAWFGKTDAAQPLPQLMLSRISITALLWILLLYWGLRETNRLRAVDAAIVTAVTWCVVSFLQVGTTLFVQGLVG